MCSVNTTPLRRHFWARIIPKSPSILWIPQKFYLLISYDIYHFLLGSILRFVLTSFSSSSSSHFLVHASKILCCWTGSLCVCGSWVMKPIQTITFGNTIIIPIKIMWMENRKLILIIPCLSNQMYFSSSAQQQFTNSWNPT